ncbi:16S rRNA (uracil(1498)-N(3))-methyltransferase [Actinomycetaceae bacterium TAE3-ERU4]|nr:16S rRNA (uracil(1498)-N(3))-methyltransferase [Actinomycetaceae bacterium TAE3-ERU4]
MTNPVFLVRTEEKIPVPGKQFLLTGTEAKHARVMRIAPGQELDLVDGIGTRFVCCAKNWQQDCLEVTVLAQRKDAIQPHFTVVQALAKGGRDEQSVETSTEVGAHFFIPWQAERSIVRVSGEKASKLVKKWESVALSAMKQSRRAYLPGINAVLNSKSLFQRVRLACERGALVLVLDEATEIPLSFVLSSGLKNEVWLIVGPEGGISPNEMENFTAAGARPIRLGNTVLRSSTAATVALSAISYAMGVWEENQDS